jgi:hypothetical protein
MGQGVAASFIVGSRWGNPGTLPGAEQVKRESELTQW